VITNVSKDKQQSIVNLAVWLGAVLIAAEFPATAEIAIRWTPIPTETNRIAVEVVGLSPSALRELKESHWTRAEWNQLLAVYARQGNLMTDLRMPAMIGSYHVESNLLRFEPQFPLMPGVRYQAVLRPTKLGEAAVKPITSPFEITPVEPHSTTVVKEVYPTADLLPENLLKFYIHFSAPMSRGHIYDHIQLRGENGNAIELPFLEIDEELWDPSLTRLTLFIDPGRIKRGVRPLEEIGPALEAGKRYSLVIDREWKDSTGNTLAKTFEKHFKVAPPDREPLNPQQWKIHEPKPGGSDPLEITFPKPLDHALAQRLIRVFGSGNAPNTAAVPGKVTLLDHERRWRFSPDASWTSGRYCLQIDAIIEDLAGNNIGKPFEVDVFEGIQRQITNSIVKLSFNIR
jgi:hypothetical protein